MEFLQRGLLRFGDSLTVAVCENSLGRNAVHTDTVRTGLGGDDLRENLYSRFGSGIWDRSLRMRLPTSG